MIYKDNDPLFEEGKFIYLKCEVVSSAKYFVIVQSAALEKMMELKNGFMIQKDFISAEAIVPVNPCKSCGKLLVPSSIDEIEETIFK